MFDRLLEQRKSISFASDELNMPMDLMASDWDLMANVVKDATFQSSAAQTSVSEVIPIVNIAIQELRVV